MSAPALLREQPRRATLALNFAALTGGEFCSKALAALAFAYLARVLGPADYGQLEFVLALMIFFTLLVDSGLPAFGARELAKDPASLPRLATHITALRFMMATCSFAILAAIAHVVDKPPAVKQLILLYGFSLLLVPGLLAWLFQGRDMMPFVAAASALRWLLFATGVFVVVGRSGQVWVVPLVEIGAIGLAVSFYLTLFVRQFGRLHPSLDLAEARAILWQALPIGASELVWAAKTYFATVLLGLMIAGSDVGWFAAAHRLVLALHTFVFLYFFNLLPTLARACQGSLAELRPLLARSIQITTWAALLIGLLGTAFAEVAMTTIFGPRYQQAGVVLALLIWMVPLALFSGNYRYALIAHGKQRLELLTAVGGAALNIGLSLLLIPRLGLQGAALSIVASEALILVLAYYAVRRVVVQLPIWPQVWRPLSAGGVLAGVLYVVGPASLWLGGGLAVLAYGLALLLLRPETVSDVRSIIARGR